MAPRKLLIMSDAPTSSTGLGRITRELAIRIHENLSDVIKVGTFGFGGPHSRHLPYYNNQIHRLDNWIAPELPMIWRDFAGDEKGILLAIWNPVWLPWLANPSSLPPSGLRDFLTDPPFEKWIYAPIDAEGVGGKLQERIKNTLGGFDRVLAYTDWAAHIIAESMYPGHDEGETIDYLPHGIDRGLFYPRDASEARNNFIQSVSGRHTTRMKDDIKIVGIVATNSARKDWALGFEACASLLRDGENIGVWAHTDYYQNHWDLVGMANEFGLARRVIFTNSSLNDDTMATYYSACDVTMAIGSGEGFGYPIAESLACGTPVVHGWYAGGAEMVPQKFLVDPIGYRWDGGPYFAKRPVFDAEEWALTASKAMVHKSTESLLDPQYYWENLWPRWAEWLTEGVNG